MLPDTVSEGVGAGAILLALIAAMRFFTWRQIRDLTKRVDGLEKKYDSERGLKHKAYNDVARTTMALDLVQRLAKECTCGVLAPLQEVVARLVSELETMPHRRSTDLEGDPA